MTTRSKRIGAGIAVAASTVAAAGILSGQIGSRLAVGIAVIGIVIGTGVARGKASAMSANSTVRKN